jgi:CRP/FNR family transcriptional regulator, cyclic AMP receptor protein
MTEVWWSESARRVWGLGWNMQASKWDVEQFLAARGRARTCLVKGAVVYSQAAVANAVYYLKAGKIKLEVVSRSGKNAVVAVLEPDSFFGEGCLIGDEYRRAAAVAIVESEVMRVEKAAMLGLLRAEPDFAEFFWNRLLLRTRRIEEDLVDQLVNSTERRLARALLLLAHFDRDGQPQPISPRVSHETLAEMIGAARPRVSQFMHKFRKMGYISYENGLVRVQRSLLSVLQPSPMENTVRVSGSMPSARAQISHFA